MNSKFKKIVALICIAALGTTGMPAVSLASPAPQILTTAADFPTDLARLVIPETLGTIEEAFLTGGNRTVILIQDAHAVPEAQNSIRKLIAYFQKEYGVRSVAVEGASGPLDPFLLKKFPDQARLKKVMRAYHDRAELSGSSAAALFDTSASRFEGVENWPLYEEGISYYQKALKKEPGILKKLGSERVVLEQEKQRLYSPQLLAYDKLLSQNDLKQSRLFEVLKTAGRIQAAPAGSAVAALLTRVRSADVSEEKVQREAQQALQVFRKSLAEGRKAVPPSLNAAAQSFETGEISVAAFALILRTTARREKVTLVFSPELRRQVALEIKLNQIKGTQLYRDLQDYLRKVKESLMRSADEKRLDQKSHVLDLKEKLARLELTREEWEELKASKVQSPKSKVKGEEALIKTQDTRHKSQAENADAVSFYENAEKREGAFLDQLNQLLDKPSKRSTPARRSFDGGIHDSRSPIGASTAGATVIFVAGGFHSRGLAQRLHKENIRYLLLTPKIKELPENSAYQAQMMGEVSWKNYFRVEHGRVNLRDAFMRAARDELLGQGQSLLPEGTVPGGSGDSPQALYPRSTIHDPRLLKTWRDDMIRGLADEHRLQDAGQYTRFLDEVQGLSPLPSGTVPRAPDSLLSRLTRFIDGLKHLDSTKQLTEENIFRLLKSNIDAGQHPTPALSDVSPVRAHTNQVPSVGSALAARSELRGSLLGFLDLKEDRLRSEVRPQPEDAEEPPVPVEPIQAAVPEKVTPPQVYEALKGIVQFFIERSLAELNENPDVSIEPKISRADFADAMRIVTVNPTMTINTIPDIHLKDVVPAALRSASAYWMTGFLLELAVRVGAAGDTSDNLQLLNSIERQIDKFANDLNTAEQKSFKRSALKTVQNLRGSMQAEAVDPSVTEPIWTWVLGAFVGFVVGPVLRDLLSIVMDEFLFRLFMAAAGAVLGAIYTQTAPLIIQQGEGAKLADLSQLDPALRAQVDQVFTAARKLPWEERDLIEMGRVLQSNTENQSLAVYFLHRMQAQLFMDTALGRTPKEFKVKYNLLYNFLLYPQKTSNRSAPLEAFVHHPTIRALLRFPISARSEVRGVQEPAGELTSKTESEMTVPSHLAQVKQQVVQTITTARFLRLLSEQEALKSAQALLALWQENKVFRLLIAERGINHFDLSGSYETVTTLGDGLELKHVLFGTQDYSYPRTYPEIFFLNGQAVGFGAFQPNQAKQPGSVEIGFKIVAEKLKTFQRPGLARDIFIHRLSDIYSLYGPSVREFSVSDHQLIYDRKAPVFYRKLFFESAEDAVWVTKLVSKSLHQQRLTPYELEWLQTVSATKSLVLNLDSPVDTRLLQAYSSDSETGQVSQSGTRRAARAEVRMAVTGNFSDSMSEMFGPGTDLEKLLLYGRSQGISVNEIEIDTHADSTAPTVNVYVDGNKMRIVMPQVYLEGPRQLDADSLEELLLVTFAEFFTTKKIAVQAPDFSRDLKRTPYILIDSQNRMDSVLAVMVFYQRETARTLLDAGIPATALRYTQNRLRSIAAAIKKVSGIKNLPAAVRLLTELQVPILLEVFSENAALSQRLRSDFDQQLGVGSSQDIFDSYDKLFATSTSFRQLVTSQEMPDLNQIIDHYVTLAAGSRSENRQDFQSGSRLAQQDGRALAPNTVRSEVRAEVVPPAGSILNSLFEDREGRLDSHRLRVWLNDEVVLAAKDAKIFPKKLYATGSRGHDKLERLVDALIQASFFTRPLKMNEEDVRLFSHEISEIRTRIDPEVECDSKSDWFLAEFIFRVLQDKIIKRTFARVAQLGEGDETEKAATIKFKNWIRSAQKKLDIVLGKMRRGEPVDGNIIFVISHPKPDYDAVVSSLGEGYLQYLKYENDPKILVVPLLMESLPELGHPAFDTLVHLDIDPSWIPTWREIAKDQEVLRAFETMAQVPASQPVPIQFILVDHAENFVEPRYQPVINPLVTMILDHHTQPSYDSPQAQRLVLPRLRERLAETVGSTATLMARHFIETGRKAPKALQLFLLMSLVIDSENMHSNSFRSIQNSSDGVDERMYEQLALLLKDLFPGRYDLRRFLDAYLVQRVLNGYRLTPQHVFKQDVKWKEVRYQGEAKAYAFGSTDRLRQEQVQALWPEIRTRMLHFTPDKTEAKNLLTSDPLVVIHRFSMWGEGKTWFAMHGREGVRARALAEYLVKNVSALHGAVVVPDPESEIVFIKIKKIVQRKEVHAAVTKYFENAETEDVPIRNGGARSEMRTSPKVTSEIYQSIASAFNNPDSNPQQLLDALSQIEEIKAAWDRPTVRAQVNGQEIVITLGEHTKKVLELFDRYFKGRPLPGKFNPALFRFMLAVHDLVKTEAGVRDASENPLRDTVAKVKELFEGTDKLNWDLTTVYALIENDAIGLFFQPGRLSLEEAVAQIKTSAAKASLDLGRDDEARLRAYFDLKSIYHQLDILSYSNLGSGIYAVEKVFEVDPLQKGPEGQSLPIFDGAKGRLRYISAADKQQQPGKVLTSLSESEFERLRSAVYESSHSRTEVSATGHEPDTVRPSGRERSDYKDQKIKMNGVVYIMRRHSSWDNYRIDLLADDKQRSYVSVIEFGKVHRVVERHKWDVFFKYITPAREVENGSLAVVYFALDEFLRNGVDYNLESGESEADSSIVKGLVAKALNRRAGSGPPYEVVVTSGEGQSSEVRAGTDEVSDLFQRAGVSMLDWHKTQLGIHVPTPQPLFNEILNAFPGPDANPFTVFDAGSGQGIFALRLAMSRPNAHIVGVEDDANLSADSQTVLTQAVDEGRVKSNQIEFFRDNFNSPESRQKIAQADFVFYYDAGTYDTTAWQSTLTEAMRPGARLVVLMAAPESPFVKTLLKTGFFSLHSEPSGSEWIYVLQRTDQRARSEVRQVAPPLSDFTNLKLHYFSGVAMTLSGEINGEIYYIKLNYKPVLAQREKEILEELMENERVRPYLPEFQTGVLEAADVPLLDQPKGQIVLGALSVLGLNLVAAQELVSSVEAGSTYFVIKQAAGKTIGDHLEEAFQKGDEAAVARALLTAIKALETLHTENIFHRDLNAKEVYWEPVSEKITILDWHTAVTPGHPLEELERLGFDRFRKPSRGNHKRLFERYSFSEASASMQRDLGAAFEMIFKYYHWLIANGKFSISSRVAQRFHTLTFETHPAGVLPITVLRQELEKVLTDLETSSSRSEVRTKRGGKRSAASTQSRLDLPLIDSVKAARSRLLSARIRPMQTILQRKKGFFYRGVNGEDALEKVLATNRVPSDHEGDGADWADIWPAIRKAMALHDEPFDFGVIFEISRKKARKYDLRAKTWKWARSLKEVPVGDLNRVWLVTADRGDPKLDARGTAEHMQRTTRVVKIRLPGMAGTKARSEVRAQVIQYPEQEPAIDAKDLQQLKNALEVMARNADHEIYDFAEISDLLNWSLLDRKDITDARHHVDHPALREQLIEDVILRSHKDQTSLQGFYGRFQGGSKVVLHAIGTLMNVVWFADAQRTQLRSHAERDLIRQWIEQIRLTPEEQDLDLGITQEFKLPPAYSLEQIKAMFALKSVSGSIYKPEFFLAERQLAAEQPTMAFDMKDTIEHSGNLRPGIRQLFSDLRQQGVRLVLWTSDNSVSALHFFENNPDLLDYFARVITSENYIVEQDSDHLALLKQAYQTAGVDEIKLQSYLATHMIGLTFNIPKDIALLGYRGLVDDYARWIDAIRQSPLYESAGQPQGILVDAYQDIDRSPEQEAYVLSWKDKIMAVLHPELSRSGNRHDFPTPASDGSSEPARSGNRHDFPTPASDGSWEPSRSEAGPWIIHFPEQDLAVGPAQREEMEEALTVIIDNANDGIDNLFQVSAVLDVDVENLPNAAALVNNPSRRHQLITERLLPSSGNDPVSVGILYDNHNEDVSEAMRTLMSLAWFLDAEQTQFRPKAERDAIGQWIKDIWWIRADENLDATEGQELTVASSSPAADAETVEQKMLRKSVQGLIYSDANKREERERSAQQKTVAFGLGGALAVYNAPPSHLYELRGGSEDLLASLRNEKVRLVLWTKEDYGMVLRFFKAYPYLLDYFDRVITAENYWVKRKPDRFAQFQAAYREANDAAATQRYIQTYRIDQDFDIPKDVAFLGYDGLVESDSKSVEAVKESPFYESGGRPSGFIVTPYNPTKSAAAQARSVLRLKDKIMAVLRPKLSRSEMRVSKQREDPEVVAKSYKEVGYYETLRRFGLKPRTYFKLMKGYVAENPENRLDFFALNYDEAAFLMANPDQRKPYGVSDSATTAKHLIWAALDTFPKFREARKAANIKQMAESYRADVLAAPVSQTGFFYKKVKLAGLMSLREYANLTKPVDVLDFALPKLVDEDNPNALKRYEVEDGIWNEPEYAKKYILKALDTIPGFPEARAAKNIEKMAELYRTHVINYQPVDKSKYPRVGQTSFFYERGRLKGLMINPRSFLEKVDSAAALLNFALPGLINDQNPDALKTWEVEKEYIPQRLKKQKDEIQGQNPAEASRTLKVSDSGLRGAAAKHAVKMARTRAPMQSHEQWVARLRGLVRKLPAGQEPTIANIAAVSGGELSEEAIQNKLKGPRKITYTEVGMVRGKRSEMRREHSDKRSAFSIKSRPDLLTKSNTLTSSINAVASFYADLRATPRWPEIWLVHQRSIMRPWLDPFYAPPFFVFSSMVGGKMKIPTTAIIHMLITRAMISFGGSSVKMRLAIQEATTMGTSPSNVFPASYLLSGVNMIFTPFVSRESLTWLFKLINKVIILNQSPLSDGFGVGGVENKVLPLTPPIQQGMLSRRVAKGLSAPASRSEMRTADVYPGWDVLTNVQSYQAAGYSGDAQKLIQDLQLSAKIIEALPRDEIKKAFIAGRGLLGLVYLLNLRGVHVTYYSPEPKEITEVQGVWDVWDKILNQRGGARDTKRQVEQGLLQEEFSEGVYAYDFVALADYTGRYPQAAKRPLMDAVQVLLRPDGYLLLDSVKEDGGRSQKGMDFLAGYLARAFPLLPRRLQVRMFQGAYYGEHLPNNILLQPATSFSARIPWDDLAMPFAKAKSYVELLISKVIFHQTGVRYLPEYEDPQEIVALVPIPADARVLSIGGAVIPFYFIRQLASGGGSVEVVDINPKQVKHMQDLAVALGNGTAASFVQGIYTLFETQVRDPKARELVSAKIEAAYRPLLNDPLLSKALDRVTFHTGDLLNYQPQKKPDIVFVSTLPEMIANSDPTLLTRLLSKMKTYGENGAIVISSVLRGEKQDRKAALLKQMESYLPSGAHLLRIESKTEPVDYYAVVPLSPKAIELWAANADNVSDPAQRKIISEKADDIFQIVHLKKQGKKKTEEALKALLRTAGIPEPRFLVSALLEKFARSEVRLPIQPIGSELGTRQAARAEARRPIHEAGATLAPDTVQSEVRTSGMPISPVPDWIQPYEIEIPGKPGERHEVWLDRSVGQSLQELFFKAADDAEVTLMGSAATAMILGSRGPLLFHPLKDIVNDLDFVEASEGLIQTENFQGLKVSEAPKANLFETVRRPFLMNIYLRFVRDKDKKEGFRIEFAQPQGDGEVRNYDTVDISNAIQDIRDGIIRAKSGTEFYPPIAYRLLKIFLFSDLQLEPELKNKMIQSILSYFQPIFTPEYNAYPLLMDLFNHAAAYRRNFLSVLSELGLDKKFSEELSLYLRWVAENWVEDRWRRSNNPEILEQRQTARRGVLRAAWVMFEGRISEPGYRDVWLKVRASLQQAGINLAEVDVPEELRAIADPTDSAKSEARTAAQGLVDALKSGNVASSEVRRAVRLTVKVGGQPVIKELTRIRDALANRGDEMIWIAGKPVNAALVHTQVQSIIDQLTKKLSKDFPEGQAVTYLLPDDEAGAVTLERVLEKFAPNLKQVLFKKEPNATPLGGFFSRVKKLGIVVAVILGLKKAPTLLTGQRYSGLVGPEGDILRGDLSDIFIPVVRIDDGQGSTDPLIQELVLAMQTAVALLVAKEIKKLSDRSLMREQAISWLAAYNLFSEFESRIIRARGEGGIAISGAAVESFLAEWATSQETQSAA